VLATLWPVEDNATALTMERFYRGLSAGSSEVTALGVAQRQAIKDPATSQPYKWAGFELSGAR